MVIIEKQIIAAVKDLLTVKGNELLSGMDVVTPVIAFDSYSGPDSVSPHIFISSCERTEKERIIRMDAYSLTITFALPGKPESEWFCYVYSAVIREALGENPTLNGLADRAAVTGAKYLSPKNPHSGEGWGVIISLRVTVEGVR